MLGTLLRTYGKYLAIGGVVVAGAWMARPRVDIPAPEAEPRLEASARRANLRKAETNFPPSTMTRGRAAMEPSPVGQSNPHPVPIAGGDGVPVGNVTKAEGEQGRTVAEVYAERRKLRGQKVRIRGVVVKRVAGVLNRVFVHVRDGSGQAKNGDHDLTVTTSVEPAVGSTVLYEGTVTTDKDFGAGYTYPVIVEEAVSLRP